MIVDVQQAAALGIVAVAVVTLARHAWKGIKAAGEGHCPGCGECGRPENPNVRSAPKATPLITLSPSGAPRRFKPPTPGE